MRPMNGRTAASLAAVSLLIPAAAGAPADRGSHPAGRTSAPGKKESTRFVANQNQIAIADAAQARSLREPLHRVTTRNQCRRHRPGSVQASPKGTEIWVFSRLPFTVKRAHL
jgi:hypothetical protein